MHTCLLPTRGRSKHTHKYIIYYTYTMQKRVRCGGRCDKHTTLFYIYILHRCMLHAIHSNIVQTMCILLNFSMHLKSRRHGTYIAILRRWPRRRVQCRRRRRRHGASGSRIGNGLLCIWLCCLTIYLCNIIFSMRTQHTRVPSHPQNAHTLHTYTHSGWPVIYAAIVCGVVRVSFVSCVCVCRRVFGQRRRADGRLACVCVIRMY